MTLRVSAIEADPARKLKLGGRLTADVVDADGVAELERLVTELAGPVRLELA